MDRVGHHFFIDAIGDEGIEKTLYKVFKLKQVSLWQLTDITERRQKRTSSKIQSHYFPKTIVAMVHFRNT